MGGDGKKLDSEKYREITISLERPILKIKSTAEVIYVLCVSEFTIKTRQILCAEAILCKGSHTWTEICECP